MLKADYTRIPGVKLFLGSSTGNMLVDNECALNEIFSKVPALVAIHSEDEQTICRNREAAIENMRRLSLRLPSILSYGRAKLALPVRCVQ